MTRAIVYVPSDAFEPHATTCMEYCEQRGYQFRGLIRGDWEAVKQMFTDDEASVVIVSDFRHLDPNRKPRLEIVPPRTEPGNEPGSDEDGDDPWHRRPRGRHL